ncbi:unnamed protein product (macronuclear) [Paramecium tetraurelia]|uniref:Uncharacterized protein n=1 Tax=Paramecium tetraurelia TaxID=5888 RepID=A0D0K7_PARTE|nr:uncharacterized protein GSPATT00012126001 [Paramecium tetraurelia]CAK76574.1 unnamed protein product [Paramecium tetraurelia]|eukprot:XP_001443971.1 hypothetical protein (macronuclear) [Paramecium tetraurelia strain d4-2]
MIQSEFKLRVDIALQCEQYKNIFYSCFITSSAYPTYNDDVVMNQTNSIIEAYQTIESPEVRYEIQMKASKRIKIDAIQYCILQQTGLTAQQMYDESEVGQFNVTQYYYLMNDFDFSQYQNQSAKITFDEAEESVWRIMEISKQNGGKLLALLNTLIIWSFHTNLKSLVNQQTNNQIFRN